MATDYGIDVLALDDLTDPEQLVSGELNVAYALARRLLTPSGAMEDIGDTSPYDSIDIREWLGARFSLTDRTVIDDLQLQCKQVMSQDPRVASVDVKISFNQGTLNVAVAAVGANGPFAFVLSVNSVNAAFLRSA